MTHDNNNSVDIHSILTTSLSKQKIAKHFKKAGWFVRKAGYDEYEIQSNYSELEIYGNDKEILMSGCINDYKHSIPEILQFLNSIKIKYQLECYDQNKNLLEKYQSP